jgi:PAS domain S-box-containing protein
VTRAYLDGEAQVIDDILDTPALATSFDAARRYGIRSAVMVPIGYNQKSVGTLSVFAAPVGHFNMELAGLLSGIATNLAYAHEKLTAEAALQASEERFRTLTTMATDWYWETDAEHHFTHLSPGAKTGTMGAFNITALVGKTRWASGMLDMSEAEIQTHREQVDRHEPFRDFEYRRIDAVGKVHSALINGDPVLDVAGRFAGYRGTGRSVTVQRQAERVLAASALEYRKLFDTSPSLIRVNCDGRVVLANRAAIEFFGGGAEANALGVTMIESIHPDFRVLAQGYVRQVIQSGQKLHIDRLMIVGFDGRVAEVELELLPHTYEGRPAVMAIVTDVTVRRAAERRVARLAQLNHALSQTNQAIVRERDWQALCNMVCRIAVDKGALLSARIRMHAVTTDLLVEFAKAGVLEQEFASREISASASNSPPALCFRRARRHINNNLDDPELDDTTRERVLPLGVASAATFPIIWNGVVFGTLAVFSGEPGYFDDELSDVIEEMAGNLGMAHAKMKADADLLESEARLSGMVDSAMDAIVTVDETMRIVVFNRAAEQIFGAPAAGMLGSHIDSLLPQRLRAGHADHIRAFGTSGSTSRAMGRLGHVTALRASGDEFEAEASISYTIVDGRTLYTVILRDVTERLAAQRAVEEAEARFRSLVEHSHNGITLLDADTIVYANPGLVRMLDRDSRLQLIGVNIFDLIMPEYHDLVRTNLGKLARGELGRIPYGRLRLRKPDGSLIDVDAAVASIRLGGKPLLQVELRNVTREVQAAAEVRALNTTLELRVAERTAELGASNRELETANHDLESFSYSVAHDLRAPLRAMSGFAQLLKLDIDDKAFDESIVHAGRIIASAERMNALIDGLLNVARASRDAMHLEPVDSLAMVEDILLELHARSRARVTVEPLPVVQADRLALRQVWVNLISNALKYSAKREQPVIAIRCGSAPGECAFSVADNGAGFEPAHAQRLFGTFQRLHNPAEFEGIGIGLAIVKRIVERHGGRVWAEGKAGVGATFHFALPATGQA